MLLTDSTSRLSIEEVSKKPFQPINHEQPNLGADALVHWVRFTCGNADTVPKHLILEIDNVFFDAASFYVVADQRLRQKIAPISWHTPPERRPVVSRYYAFPLELGARQSVQVLVRLQAKGGILICPITLWERTHYQQEYQFYTLVYLIPISVLFIITLISLLCWAAYRKRILIYYALYTGGILGFALNIEGFVVDYAALPLAGPEGWVVCSSIAWIGNLLFTDRYVFYQYRIPHTVLRRYCFTLAVGCILVFLGITLLVPFNGLLAFTSLVINSLAPLFIFGWLLIGLRYHLPEARLYVVAVIPVMLCVMLIALGGAGIFPNGDKVYVLFYYAPPIEIIILGFGVVRQFFREREKLLLTVQSVQEELINTQESERERIAADLHDDLGGTLVAIRYRLANLRRDVPGPETALSFDQLEVMIQQSCRDLRRISHNLMPPEFARTGLRSALEHLVRSVSSHPTRFTFVALGPERKLPLDTELNLYRIASELIHNVLKHAQARRAAVQVLYHPDQLVLLVEDDGVGNQSEKTAGGREGIGLKTSSLRADYIGARMRREASPSGTLVVVELPYPPASNATPESG